MLSNLEECDKNEDSQEEELKKKTSLQNEEFEELFSVNSITECKQLAKSFKNVGLFEEMDKIARKALEFTRNSADLLKCIEMFYFEFDLLDAITEAVSFLIILPNDDGLTDLLTIIDFLLEIDLKVEAQSVINKSLQSPNNNVNEWKTFVEQLKHHKLFEEASKAANILFEKCLKTTNFADFETTFSVFKDMKMTETLTDSIIAAEDIAVSLENNMLICREWLELGFISKSKQIASKMLEKFPDFETNYSKNFTFFLEIGMTKKELERVVEEMLDLEKRNPKELALSAEIFKNSGPQFENEGIIAAKRAFELCRDPASFSPFFITQPSQPLEKKLQTNSAIIKLIEKKPEFFHFFPKGDSQNENKLRIKFAKILIELSSFILEHCNMHKQQLSFQMTDFRNTLEAIIRENWGFANAEKALKIVGLPEEYTAKCARNATDNYHIKSRFGILQDRIWKTRIEAESQIHCNLKRIGCFFDVEFLFFGANSEFDDQCQRDNEVFEEEDDCFAEMNEEELNFEKQITKLKNFMCRFEDDDDQEQQEYDLDEEVLKIQEFQDFDAAFFEKLEILLKKPDISKRKFLK